MWSRTAVMACVFTVLSVAPAPASEPEPPRAEREKPTLPAVRVREETLPRILANEPPTPISPPVVDLGTPDLGSDFTPFKGRLSLRGDAGRGVGYERGFSYLEGMVPLSQNNGSLFFSDLRVVNLHDEHRWEGNVGLGCRWFSEPVHRVLGVNLFYDVRKTDFNTFQQIGIGLEALSPCAEFRMNGYFIVGPAHRFAGPPVFLSLGANNGNFVTQRFQALEVAHGGLDLEVGGPLPNIERMTPRAYLGCYTYSAEGARTINGIRGRLEAQLSEQVSLHFAIQHDRRFDTTVTGGLAIHFGAPAYRTGPGGPARWEDVIRQRVVRDINIVVTDEVVPTTFTTPVPPAETTPVVVQVPR